MKKSTFKKQAGHIPARLIDAVVNQIGGWESFKESAPNIARHGIDGGFIYYSDTHSFAVKNRKAIVELLESTADSMGVDVVEMVAGFGVFRHSPMDADDKKDLYRYLVGGRPEQGTITNVMAWFAAEEVARAYDDIEYNN